MNVVVEELGACRKKLTVQLSADEVNKEFQTVIQNVRKSVALPGFRKGKASLSTIKRRFRRQIHDEVKEKLLENSLKDALVEQKLSPSGTPSVDLKSIKVSENKALEYAAEIEFWPEFDLQDYKGLEISKKRAAETTDEQIHEALDELRRQNATHEPLDETHVIVDNDNVTVDYQRSLEGEPFGEPVKGVSFVLGVDQVFPELSENVFGKHKGDRVEFSTTYSEDAPNKSLAGKTLDFSMQIVNVEKVVLPELDDEFAKDLEEESLEELRQKIAENIKSRAELNLVADAKNRLLLNMAESYDFDVPPSILEAQKKTYPDKEDAELVNMVRAGLLLAKIQEQEGIEVSDEEVDAALERMATGQGLPVAVLRQYLTSQPNGFDRIISDIRESKTQDFLYEHAKVVEEDA
ncbi:trigger factor [candidate division KSB3 bacterium]|uniref:Trigger factor n=1 Tax=candidate division KSB3 bacterium TaxID=2044937 RepID=A0A2G6E4P3_9BACT|nr:MAG: trigger factor [candidate division KSB3 bacterium]PIE29658.1 MAG: trigger factor [candidate division KSB3 bacterium]